MGLRPPLRLLLGSMVIYVLLWLDILPTPLISTERKNQIIPLLPWWALISLGSYCLWTLGWGVCTFGDCPEAYEELMGEITQARDELRPKGVRVD